MRQLLWKEWHEQAWKLGFGCIMLGTLALLGFRSRLLADETTILWISTIGLTLLPITACTGLIPAERGDGTLEMLLSMPISRWRIVMTKIITGVALVAGPLLLAMMITLAVARDREMPLDVICSLYLRSIATALMLLAWMFAATARLPSEARAGMIAVGMLIIWELITLGLQVPAYYAFTSLVQPEPYYRLLITPMVFVYGASDSFIKSPPVMLSLLVQMLLAAVLVFITQRQFVLTDSND